MALLELLSYALDWVVLVALAGVGFVVGNLRPRGRPFRLDDPNISLPFNGDTISISTAFLVSIVAPAVIITLLSLAINPRPTTGRHRPAPASPWLRKIWELHASVLGLALSVVLSWIVTSAFKNLLGKPRPNFLSRCQPDLSQTAQQLSTASGVIASYSASGLHTATICTNQDSSVVDEGLRSFPSGHSSVAAAGLLYLTLYLAGRFAILAPYFTFSPGDQLAYTAAEDGDLAPSPEQAHDRSNSLEAEPGNQQGAGIRTYLAYEPTAPPLYLTIIALIPLAAGIFIAASRWFDYQHHGFDILISFLLGCLTAVISYFTYHSLRARGPAFARIPRRSKEAFWTKENKGEIFKRSGSGAHGGRQDLEAGDWVQLRNMNSNLA